MKAINQTRIYHICPHHDCSKQLPLNMYACKDHWFKLPKRIRDDIWKGYNNNSSLWDDADRKARIYWRDRGIT